MRHEDSMPYGTGRGLEKQPKRSARSTLREGSHNKLLLKE
jgi:hypothetical protein